MWANWKKPYRSRWTVHWYLRWVYFQTLQTLREWVFLNFKLPSRKRNFSAVFAVPLAVVWFGLQSSGTVAAWLCSEKTPLHCLAARAIVSHKLSVQICHYFITFLLHADILTLITFLIYKTVQDFLVFHLFDLTLLASLSIFKRISHWLLLSLLVLCHVLLFMEDLPLQIVLWSGISV